ncbi:MAG: LysR substrate-binding domain-containing protein [Chloroflexi bacterium]|nr:LysR substrate-binding domain-containing protein [Chloroflexota bacterium]
MTRARTTLAIVAFAALVGCTVKSPASTPATALSTLTLYSTEASYKLMQDLAKRFEAQYGHIAIDIRKRSFDTLTEQFDNGEIDYLVSSHVPVREDLWAAPLAQDGLAIIVNPANSITALTVDDLRSVFGGRQRDWSAFGAEPTAVVPLSYQAGSDVHQEFQRLVMGMTSITGNALLMPSFEAMLQQVSELDGAIGYLPLSGIDDRARALAIDGVRPTESSVKHRRYPLRSTIYVIGREAPSADTFYFFGWVQSEAGQKVVSESYIALP